MVSKPETVVQRVEYPSIPVDLDGDGIPDVVGVDTTGDGKVDTYNKYKRTPEETQKMMLAEVNDRKRLFELSAEHYSRKDNWIVIPTILIGAVSGLLAFVSSSALVTDESTQNLIGLFVGAFATVNTVLAGMQRTLRWGTQAEIYRQASGNYRTLARRVINRRTPARRL